VGGGGYASRLRGSLSAQDNRSRAAKICCPQFPAGLALSQNFVPAAEIQDFRRKSARLAKSRFSMDLAWAYRSASELGQRSAVSMCSRWAIVREVPNRRESHRKPPALRRFCHWHRDPRDDFDDTQLCLGKDRVYGLLTHPTAPVLAALFALAEASGPTSARIHRRISAGVKNGTKNLPKRSPRGITRWNVILRTSAPFSVLRCCARMRGLTLQQP